jgi:ADP-heptose:LPS heptosyltransferase
VKILVIRNDKLGDFMLAWPAFSLLKKQYPQSNITALVPPYTQPMAELCPWIDHTLVDHNHGPRQLARQIKAGRYHASLSLFSEFRTAMALWLARVPLKIGPATKIAQVFLNRKLRQKRSLSHKPEYLYNLDLARFYIELNGDIPTEPKSPPYLEFSRDQTRALRAQYFNEHEIPHDARLVFIHPGSGGSAVNLTLNQFAKLADRLTKNNNVYFVITAGPDELETAKSLARLLPEQQRSIYHSIEGLVTFARFIGISDLFISGSTGPLHIAGALNVPTTAFYPARRSATALRWMTLNEENRRIAFSPDHYNKAAKELDIDIDRCALEVSYFLKRLYNS